LPGILDKFYIYLKSAARSLRKIYLSMGRAVAMAPPPVRIYPVMKNSPI